MLTTVYNLKTLEVQEYTCTPDQAVKSAYALENNLMTQLACNTLKATVFKGKNFVTCGDWTSRYQ